MRIIKGFKLRSVAGEMVVSGEGVNQINFNKLIALNSTAAYLWQQIVDEDFDAQKLADLLVDRFMIDPETALVDAKSIIESWIECGIIGNE